MEILLEECESCEVYCPDLNGDRLCGECQLAGVGPEPFWVPPTDDPLQKECYPA